MVQGLLKQARTGTPEEAVSKLLQNPVVKRYTGEATAYRLMITDFVRVARNVSLKSTRRIVHDGCRCTLHEFPDRLCRRMVFMWSRKEPALRARNRVMKHYPHALDHRLADVGTLGLLVRNPAQYARLLKGLALMDARES